METKEQREKRLAGTYKYKTYTWSAGQNYSSLGYGIALHGLPKREKISIVSDKLKPIKWR